MITSNRRGLISSFVKSFASKYTLYFILMVTPDDRLRLYRTRANEAIIWHLNCLLPLSFDCMHESCRGKKIDWVGSIEFTYRSHSIAKRIAAPSLGTPIEERIVTTSTILELGMLGTARVEANVSNLQIR